MVITEENSSAVLNAIKALSGGALKMLIYFSVKKETLIKEKDEKLVLVIDKEVKLQYKLFSMKTSDVTFNNNFKELIDNDILTPTNITGEYLYNSTLL